MQNLSHEGRQLRHERLVAVVLAHVRQHDGPEWHRQQDLAPRDRRRLLGIYIGLKKDCFKVIFDLLFHVLEHGTVIISRQPRVSKNTLITYVDDNVE